MGSFTHTVLSASYEIGQELVLRATEDDAKDEKKPTRPASFKYIGISLAITSGLFIGVSFVLKKHGLLKANEKYQEVAGEGYGYLRNWWWWAGMTIMIVGEICNFVAYAFTDAILVTPLGALAVVVTTILSAIFLKERLSIVGKVGCFLCIIGSVVIVMNAPEESAVADIQEMQSYVIHPAYLTYAGVIIVGSAFAAWYAGPRWGNKNMLVYISICSWIGGLSVVAIQGLGAAIVAQAGGKSQFNQWFLYVLLVFVIATLVTEIIYLNKALNLFNAAIVTPTYYVYFTSTTIISSAVLFRGFRGTPSSIVTIVNGFLTICSGVVLLQLSKSAKEVPDAAVFKGDLDQLQTIAEQEEPETEPKADAIRGTAALVRRLSSIRSKMEEEEFQRMREESRLGTASTTGTQAGDGSVVYEWDGLRRRPTISLNSLRPTGSSAFSRSRKGSVATNNTAATIPEEEEAPRPTIRTVYSTEHLHPHQHPPLGMSRILTDEEIAERERQGSPAFFSSVLGTLRRKRTSRNIADHQERQGPLYGVIIPEHNLELDETKFSTSTSPLHNSPYISSTASAADQPNHPRTFGSPPSSPPRKTVSAAKRPRSSIFRKLSFQTSFHRERSLSDPDASIVSETQFASSNPGQPTSASSVQTPSKRHRSGSSHTYAKMKKHVQNATEEERLGLVEGGEEKVTASPSPPRPKTSSSRYRRIDLDDHSTSNSRAQSDLDDTYDDYLKYPDGDTYDDYDDDSNMYDSTLDNIDTGRPPLGRPVTAPFVAVTAPPNRPVYSSASGPTSRPLTAQHAPTSSMDADADVDVERCDRSRLP